MLPPFYMRKLELEGKRLAQEQIIRVKISFQSVLSSLPLFPQFLMRGQVLKLGFSPDVSLCLSHLPLHCTLTVVFSLIIPFRFRGWQDP
ncbi:unnamed protein product, partial [Gulo gulo]